jgi:co-chaperonin GroES (HSP10)
MFNTQDVAEEPRVASTLPAPSGYKLLIALPESKDKVGSILIPESVQAREQIGAIVGFVVAVGPDAYKDPVKFPSGPWCKEGDWVILRTYSGTRVKVFGKEFRFVNDDTVDGIVEDPRGVERA